MFSSQSPTTNHQSPVTSDRQSPVTSDRLKDSGLIVVVGGSNCSVNTDVCIQIQNAPNVDVAAIVEAAVQRHKRDRTSGR